MSIYLFISFALKKKIEINNITIEIIFDFLNELLNLNWSLSYLDRARFDFRAFLSWMFNNKITNIPSNLVIPKINWHNREKIKSYYSIDEIQDLLNAIDTNTEQGKEDFLIFNLICYLGLRISDVINLKISNIDFNTETISIIQWKTKKPLVLPLISNIKYALLDYLKNVRPSDSNIDYIFITKTKPYKQKITIKNSRKVTNYMIKAGIDINGRKHGYHALRFSLGELLLQENIDLYAISTILGHTSVKTTTVYLEVDISKLRDLALEVPLC